MKRLIAICFLSALGGNLTLAQEPAKTGFPVVKVPVRWVAKLPPALSYALLPEPGEMKAGNAALMWLRAARLATEIKPPFFKEESAWTDKDGNNLTLKDLPRKRLREILDRYRIVLELADIAAHRSDCDWDLPLLSMRDSPEVYLSEVQSVRLLANLLILRVRLEIAEHQYDKAVHTLQIGFALAQHVGTGPTSIHTLVGIAIAAIMVGRVTEFIEQPDAPPLFWALTMLPQPFLDLRKPMAGEMAMMGRSFPFLSGARKADLTAAEAEALLAEGIKQMDPQAGLAGTLTAAGLVASSYPEAKRALLARGRDAKQVESMRPVQVVAIYLAHQFAEMRDELLKSMYLPYWQGHQRIEAVQKRYGMDKKDRNLQTVLFGLAVPAFAKVYTAWARIDRQLAGLRCAEAIRLHAASHGGQLPKTLAEITDIPLPMDPITGKGMDSWYKLEADGTGVLEVPPPPATPIPLLGRRYELVPVQG